MKRPIAAAPWPWNWEAISSLAEEHGVYCDHGWETVLVRPRGRGWSEPCDWCPKCKAPRCEGLHDGGARCLERRHHPQHVPHRYADGTFSPVGGGEVWS